jgi:hypothetical protein
MAENRSCVSWNELPHGGSSEEDWSAFKSTAYEELQQSVQEIDRKYADEPQARVERIRELRREHHLIVIADRVRRSSLSPGEYSGEELRKQAEFILDRTAYIAADGEAVTQPRSRLEENMVVSARVSWHKLMRRAGSRAELRGSWGPRKSNGGTTAILRKVSAPGLKPDDRAEILREHIEERVQQLLYVARQVTDGMNGKLTRNDRLLIRELEYLLQRAQFAKRQKRPATKP